MEAGDDVFLFWAHGQFPDGPTDFKLHQNKSKRCFYSLFFIVPVVPLFSSWAQVLAERLYIFYGIYWDYVHALLSWNPVLAHLVCVPCTVSGRGSLWTQTAASGSTHLSCTSFSSASFAMLMWRRQLPSCMSVINPKPGRGGRQREGRRKDK